ncbi:MAG: Flp pilus assembly complex ATPase component TadA [Planctomycetes bacterium]|nr:Flp pilus assembly complex ATPase component TadA [Planctomycetota bacterium]
MARVPVVEWPEDRDDSAPVPTLVFMVLGLAIKDGATELHVEPQAEECKMNYRVNGILYEMVPPPWQIAQNITNRLKVLADLDTGKSRVVQEGSFRLQVEDEFIEVAVRSQPTPFGEAAHLRFPDPEKISTEIRQRFRQRLWNWVRTEE